LIATAAVLAAAGLVVSSPAPESAAACKYEFPGSFVLNQDNGFRVEMSASGQNVSGTAKSFNNRQQQANTGTAFGGTKGNQVDIYVDWSDGRQGHYIGNIRDDLGVSGSTQDNVTGGSASWESVTKLTCVQEAAPAQAPASAPAQAPAQAPAPAAPPPPAEKKPLLGPTVSAKPGLAGVTFTFTDRSGVASQCTYSSEGFSDSFALPANGSTDLFVAAIRQFRTRTGTVACDNGTSSPTSVEF
jgi:hypothetical protein